MTGHDLDLEACKRIPHPVAKVLVAEVESLRAKLAAAEQALTETSDGSWGYEKRYNEAGVRADAAEAQLAAVRELVEREKRERGGRATPWTFVAELEAILAAAEQDEPRTSLARVLTLADGWDGGATQGRAHITRCVRVHPCPQCLLAEAAMDLREAVTCTHEWVKMPNLKWDVCVQCGIERRNSGNCRTVSRPEPTPEQP